MKLLKKGTHKHIVSCNQRLNESEHCKKAWDEGYVQAIDDLIEEGVIGESDEEDDYSEYVLVMKRTMRKNIVSLKS